MAARSRERGEYEREFAFTGEDFETLRILVKQQAGINLTAAKQDMVYARLARRLRATGTDSFRAYCELVHQSQGELVNLINAITTNLTAFFREPHHFEHLQRVVIPSLVLKKGTQRRLRIWSAGCSSGEEPYSLAMAVLEALPQPDQWDVQILASDLDSSMVEKAARGVYAAERVQGVSPRRLKTWMQAGAGPNEGMVRMRQALRSRITFRQLNLMDAWPMRQPFDVIFCRNVVIYFDKPTQRQLFERFANQLADQGWLYIGHSESLYGVSERFRGSGKTIYQKVK